MAGARNKNLETAKRQADDDVQRKSGIYEYLLSGGAREKALSIRAFTESQKRAAYERQTAIAKKRGVSNCPMCANGTGGADATRTWCFEEMEGDHIVPWSRGGKTVPENLQMLCRRCNATKSDK